MNKRLPVLVAATGIASSLLVALPHGGHGQRGSSDL